MYLRYCQYSKRERTAIPALGDDRAVDGSPDQRRVHLRERLASGSIWVDGSRAYRTLDDYLLPEPAFAAMREEGRLGLAVAHGFQDWYEERREQLTRRMNEVKHAAAAGKLVDVVIAGGELTVSPLRRAVPDEAEDLKARLSSNDEARARLTTSYSCVHDR